MHRKRSAFQAPIENGFSIPGSGRLMRWPYASRYTRARRASLHSPLPVEEQVVSVYAGTRGYLDEVPVEDVRRFETELLEYMRTRHGDLLEKVRETGALPADDVLEGPIADFKEMFGPGQETYLRLAFANVASEMMTEMGRRLQASV